MHKSARVVWVIMLVAAVALGCVMSGCAPGQTTAVTDQDRIAKMAVGFVNEPYLDDYGMTRIAGWVQNRSGDRLETVTLAITLLDDKGNKREKVTYEVHDVEPGKRVTFDANAGSIAGSRLAKVAIARMEVAQ